MMSSYKVKGKDLQSVNAFNLIFPYSPKELQFVKVETDPSMVMRNLTYDRHHSDGSQVLYPTFVNVGDHHTLNGDADLLVIRMKASSHSPLRTQQPKACWWISS